MNKIYNLNVKTHKNILLLFMFCCFTPSFSQVIGINTNQPLGNFHVDGNGDNTSEISTNPQQQLNDFIILKNSNIGIGTINPSSKLHIKDTIDPLRIDGLPQSDIYTDHLLLIDENNVIRRSPPMSELMLPRPAFFRLENNMVNFLKNKIDSAQSLPLNLIKNAIDNLTYDDDKATITLPEGMYKISFNYEANHPGCTLSVYYMDFPSEFNKEQTFRIPSFAEHEIPNGEHGGTISFVTILSKKTEWKLELGRSKDGTCHDSNMTLNKHATQLLITQILN